MPLGVDQTLHFEGVLERAKHAEWNKISELEDGLARASDESRADHVRQAARFAAAAQDRGTSIQDVLLFLSESETWLEAALRRAEARAGTTAVDSVSLAMQTVLGEWTDVAHLASASLNPTEGPVTQEGKSA